VVAADRLTAPGEFFGTASYLAPEQITGDPVGPTADVYALGVVAYELLTGGKPFEGDTPLKVALQHVHDAPPPLPADIPGPVRVLVLRALAKDPADRWPSAAALAAAAAAAISGPSHPAGPFPVPAGPPPFWPPLAPAPPPAADPAPAAAGATGTASPALFPASHSTAGPVPPSAAASSASPVPVSSAPASPVPVSSAPASPVPVSSAPASSAPASPSPAPASPTPDSPSLDLPAPGLPADAWLDGGRSGRGRLAVVVAVAVALVLTAAVGAGLYLGSHGGPAGHRPQAVSGRPSAGMLGASTRSSSPTSPLGAPAGPGSTPPDPTVSTTAGPTGAASTPSTGPSQSPGADPTVASSGTSEVPDMYGWPEAKVTAQLKHLGLVAHITYQVTSDKCYVISQSPAGHTVVAAGSSVDVVVATATGVCKHS
jgi:serine/threonine-protein kinase